MKILILADQVSRPGGLERSLAYKVGYWCEIGHSIEIVTIERSEQADFYPFPASVRRFDLGVHYDRTVPLLTLKNLRKACIHFLRLRSRIKNSSADIVINCGFGFDFYFLPIIASKKLYLIKENHSSRYPGQRLVISVFGKLKKHLRKFFDQRYNACVFLSKEEAYLAQVKNAVVIPNPMPTILMRSSGLVEKRNVVIAAGRVCTFKGFDQMVRSWALVAPLAFNWHLEIYGNGEVADVENLQQLIDSLCLTQRISLKPATAKIFDHIAESRIFAMTSRTECFPMVLLEAMQLGVPIVAFDCPTGPRNILLDQKTGILVKDGDCDAFAASLLKLINSELLQNSLAQAAKKEVSKYSMASVGKLWEQLFLHADKK